MVKSPLLLKGLDCFGLGCVDVWSTETGGEPIHHYQTPGRIQALALSPDSPVLVSAAGSDVRLDCAKDCGYWRTVCRAQLAKAVSPASSFVSNDTCVNDTVFSFSLNFGFQIGFFEFWTHFYLVSC